MKFKRSLKLRHQLYVAWNLKMRFFEIKIKNVLKILLNKVLSSFLAEVETERDSFRDEMLKLKTDLVTLGPVDILKYRHRAALPSRIPLANHLKKRKDVKWNERFKVKSVQLDQMSDGLMFHEPII